MRRVFTETLRLSGLIFCVSKFVESRHPRISTLTVSFAVPNKLAGYGFKAARKFFFLLLETKAAVKVVLRGHPRFRSPKRAMMGEARR